MRTRIDFDNVLRDILGTTNVYYQPPESFKVGIPGIIYKLGGIPIRHADDGNYIGKRRYQVTLIDPNPDSPIFEKLLALPYSEFDRAYSSNNLNHFTFTIYY